MSTHRPLTHRGRTRALARLCAAAVTAWLVACAPGPAEAAILDPRGIQSEAFSNGLRLIVSSEPDASVIAVEVIVKVGSADEPQGQRGIAHLLEHVLWAGAGAGDQDPRRRIERVGGVINGGTLRDFTRFYATVPAGSLEAAVDALGDVVARSKIDPVVFARERQVIVQETTARQEDPRTVLNDAAFAVVYGASSAYGSPIGGDAGDLGTVDVSALALFREKWYVPNNMAVVVAGNVSFDAARAAVQRVFGPAAPSPLPDRARDADRLPASAGEHRIELPITKAYVMAAFAGPEASEHPQVCATDLMSTLLAHDPVGRLVVELKEQQAVADEVGIDFLTQRQRSLFGVWALCDPGELEQAKSAIRAELARVAREPVPIGELATAKRLLAAGYAFANETPADRASTLAFYEAIDTYRAASYYLSWVIDVSPHTLMATAAQYSGEPAWIILVPGGARQ
jgi:predicted Zn-dependent peptidase